MNDTNKIKIEEQEAVQEILKVLQDHGTTEQVSALKSLVQYIDTMERQFQQIYEEVNNINNYKSQNIPNYDAVLSQLPVVKSHAQKYQEQFFFIKRQFQDSIKEFLDAFKQQGYIALDKLVKGLKIENCLISLKNMIHNVQEDLKQDLDKLELIGNEVNGVKLHIDNIERIKTGEEIHEKVGNHERNAMEPLIKPLKVIVGQMEELEGKMDRALENVRRLEQHQREMVYQRAMNNMKRSSKQYVKQYVKQFSKQRAANEKPSIKKQIENIQKEQMPKQNQQVQNNQKQPVPEI